MATIRKRIENNFYEKFDNDEERLPLGRGVITIDINGDIIILDLSNEDDIKFLINLLYNSELHRLDFSTNAWDEITERCYEAEDWYAQTLQPVEILDETYDVLEVFYFVDIDRYTEILAHCIGKSSCCQVGCTACSIRNSHVDVLVRVLLLSLGEYRSCDKSENKQN